MTHEEVEAAREAERREEAERRAAESVAQRLDAACVPQRYRRATMDGVSEDLRAHVQAFCDDLRAHVRAGHGLVVAGGVGSGKSHVLGVIAAHAAGAGVAFLYADARQMKDALCLVPFGERKAVGEEGGGPQAWGQPYASVPLLLLDEFDSSLATDAAFPVGRMETLIEARYANEKATVFVLNVTWADFAAKPEYRRIADRLRETCVIVEIADESGRVPYAARMEQKGLGT